MSDLNWTVSSLWVTDSVRSFAAVACLPTSIAFDVHSWQVMLEFIAKATLSTSVIFLFRTRDRLFDTAQVEKTNGSSFSLVLKTGRRRAH